MRCKRRKLLLMVGFPPSSNRTHFSLYVQFLHIWVICSVLLSFHHHLEHDCCVRNSFYILIAFCAHTWTFPFFLSVCPLFLVWQRILTNLHVNKCVRNSIALQVIRGWNWDVVTRCHGMVCVIKRLRLLHACNRLCDMWDWVNEGCVCVCGGWGGRGIRHIERLTIDELSDVVSISPNIFGLLLWMGWKTRGSRS